MATISAAAAATVAPSCSSAIASASRSSFAVSSSLRGPSLGAPLRASITRSGLNGASPCFVRAATSTDEASSTSSTTSLQTDELIADLKAKWDSIEDKTNVLVYAGGALVALWVSSTIVGAVNSVPLLPKVLELVGLGYTGWFVYKYLLFKDSRKELVRDIEELKAKIAGGGKE